MSWRSKVVQQREPCGSAGRVRADIVWATGGLIEAQISHCRDPLLRAGQACASSTPLQAQDLRVTHQRLLHLVLDSSASMSYGSGAITKHRYATLISAALAHLMLRQRDAVGLVSFDSVLRTYLPPRSINSYLHTLLHAIEAACGY